MDAASLAEVEEELREVERALVRLEERREGLQERREAILKVTLSTFLSKGPRSPVNVLYFRLASLQVTTLP